MAKKDAHGFELDKNDFVMLTKLNAELAQKKVDGSPKEVNEKKASKIQKTLRAIGENSSIQNELCQLIQEKAKVNFSGGFLEIIRRINITNSTRLSGEEQEEFAEYIRCNKEKILKQIKKGEVGVVNDIAEAGAKTSKKRYNFSFASKFCTYISRYHFNEYDKFMPYDNVLQSVLPYYAWVYCKIKKVEDFKKKGNYQGYIDLARKIIEQSQVLYGSEERLTLKEFDRLLWYKYKGLLGEDLIGNPNSLLIKET